ncbi:peptidyl-prolyl cis-trans isomerase [Brassica rapa]|uniref:peptidyl-prolyl cis-trans isomerase n=1 Tax=Brassica campestris TaxID=3711 RepID=UPI000872CEE5|nr:peptidyl-prolyl cis-trans isomerase [Brassica rapa]
MANPRVFFDMTVDGKPAGRIVMELFADTTPRTAENFRSLCTGEKGIGKFGKPLHYKGSIIHEVFPGYTLCGGDIIGGKFGFAECIYGSRFFDDENFIKMHTGPGILTMWDCRPNTNGSQTQFMICLRKIVEFDGECVLFGQVVEGLDMIENIEKEVARTDDVS